MIDIWDDNLNPFNSMKILCHWDRLNKIVDGEFPPPVTVEIDVSGCCNNRCPHCFCEKHLTKNNLLSKKETIDIIEYCIDWGAKQIIFSGGGEPLMHPRFKDVLKHIWDNKLHKKIGFALLTNGSLLTLQIAHYLTNFTYVGVSVDAACAKTRERTHGVNDFKRAIGGIKMLVRERELQRSNMRITYKFLVTQENVNEIEEATLLAKESGATEIFIRPASWPERAKEIDALMPKITETCKKCMKHANNNFKVYGITHKYKTLREHRFSKCHCTPLVAIFGADKNMYLCCRMRGTLPIGNFKEKTISEIWGSEEHKKVIESINPVKCAQRFVSF